MINKALSFDLPIPWKQKKFEITQIGAINFLVGPNGSGKSKFAEALRSVLENVRMLGTDRLSGMEQANPLKNIFGDHFANGLAKNQFPNFKSAGQQGSGIDTIVLLEERMDLRIQVEATLSHLFNRKIILEWDSGNLVARAVLGETGDSYRLDRDECHGIKELLVLLTHLYNDDHSYLIIDEPELNLHPQFQAFFMQEVRKIAGDPSADNKKKVVFLVTHSPFILDFRSIEDVKSVISFDLKHSIPKHIFDLDSAATARLSTLVPRLNVHHKQLFFSDNPIFVEGVLDAQIVGTMQEARGVSVAGAGSCIIDAGGCEEVNRYLELCRAFGKNAHFLYDLDSLFGGNLRACVREDGSVQSFLVTAGVGSDFSKYCGELDRKLTNVIDRLLEINNPLPPMKRLVDFLTNLGPRSQWNGKNWAKARMAVMTAISQNRQAIIEALSQSDIDEIEGRLKQIIIALKQINVILLPGGTLERYLPKYMGDHYELTDDAKRKAVGEEIEEMAKAMTTTELSDRYGELYEAVCALPSKSSVDVERVLRDYLSNYIHDLQAALVSNPTWGLDQVQAHLKTIHHATIKVFSVQKLNRESHKKFSVIVEIAEMLGQKKRFVRVTHQTNAGMGDFNIEFA
ncbi:MAG: AAA family ATPase [Deltaproteobacteria bacterium]|nr:AAA family ATPase [Deltaproteobacteria bacterium]